MARLGAAALEDEPVSRAEKPQLSAADRMPMTAIRSDNLLPQVPQASQAGPKAGLSGQTSELVPATVADYPEGPVLKMSEVQYPIS